MTLQKFKEQTYDYIVSEYNSMMKKKELAQVDQAYDLQQRYQNEADVLLIKLATAR